MATPETQRWIEAAKVLGIDPQARVDCPRCQEAILDVTDVPRAAGEPLIERHLSCPRCGAYNAMRMRWPRERGEG